MPSDTAADAGVDADVDAASRDTGAEPGSGGGSRYFVQSLDRGLAVLRALNVPGRGQTLSDVARATGLTRAATRRFLLTLEELGYVRSEDRRFSLTPRVLELGYAYISALSLPEIAQPHLRRLTDRVEESSSMSVLDGTDVVYVAREPTQRIMTVAISIGTRFPAYVTSMGRALLAGLDPAERRRLLEASAVRAVTTRTVTDLDKLEAIIERAGRAGYAIVDQELEDGLRSVAAPVHDPAGATVAAVNISTHASRTTLETMRSVLVPALLETVAAIERDLLVAR